MSKTLEDVAKRMGISRQALFNWRRKARKKGHNMVPVGAFNTETGRMVNGMTGEQIKVIDKMRKEAGQ